MNFETLRAFSDELQKIAEEPKKTTDDIGTGAAIAGAGGLSAGLAKSRITGRTNVYHGTTAPSAKRIKAEGLLPAASGGRTGVIERRGFPAEWAEKAYVTHRPTTADQYAMQSTGLRGEAPSIVRMSIPEWKAGAPKLQANPETVGGYLAWAKRNMEFAPKQLERAGLSGKDKEILLKLRKALVYSPVGLSGYLSQVSGWEKAVEGVDPKYIKGSPAYEKLTLKEIGQYAKARPKRFGAGLALGAAGLAGLGYGGHRLIKGMREE